MWSRRNRYEENKVDDDRGPTPSLHLGKKVVTNNSLRLCKHVFGDTQVV